MEASPQGGGPFSLESEEREFQGRSGSRRTDRERLTSPRLQLTSLPSFLTQDWSVTCRWDFLLVTIVNNSIVSAFRSFTSSLRK